MYLVCTRHSNVYTLFIEQTTYYMSQDFQLTSVLIHRPNCHCWLSSRHNFIWQMNEGKVWKLQQTTHHRCTALSNLLIIDGNLLIIVRRITKQMTTNDTWYHHMQPKALISHHRYVVRFLLLPVVWTGLNLTLFP